MKALFITLLCVIAFSASADDVNILNFGAVADGKTINTKAIQAAIDQCSQKGGGTVLIPDGTFMTGALLLKTNVNIHLADHALLIGSPHFIDYPNNIIQSRVRPGDPSGGRTNKALLFADGQSNIIIDGHGTIDGNGVSPEFQLGDDSQNKLSNTRPVLILMTDCTNIKVENIHLRNSAYWMQNYVDCVNVHIKGISVYNHANFNNDAIDIDSKDVLVENSSFDSDDDAICLKSHARGKICENVVVRNCSVRTNCNAIKFGTASVGGFKNIDISNITIKQASEERIRHWQKVYKFIEQPVTVISGIAIENVDGGLTDNVTVTNIFMEDVQTPIFIRLGNRRTGDPGHLRNVTISNITAVSHSKMTSSITGIPGFDAENIQLSNIKITGMGLGTTEEAALVPPESIKLYPENRMFGQMLPSSGFFVRHVKGLSLQNVQLNVRNADLRPAILMEDVKHAQISGLYTTDSLVNASTVRLLNCQNILLMNPQVKNQTLPYLVVEGDKTQAIQTYGLSQKKNLVLQAGVAKGEVDVK